MKFKNNVKATFKERHTYLDILRFLAIFLVIYTHSGSIGIHSYETTKSFLYGLNLFFVPFSQVSVTLFFMISGALLLSRRESLREVLGRRFVRIALATVLAIIIQAIYAYVKQGTPISPLKMLQSLYSGGSITQHWYLYAYMAFLLMLPFLQKLTSLMENKDYCYLFVLCIVLNILFPIWEAVSGYDSFGISVAFLNNEIFYPILGFYLHKTLCTERKYTLRTKDFLLMLSALLCLGAVNAFMNHHSLVNGHRIAYLDLFTPIYAALLFTMVFFLANSLQKKNAHTKWTSFWAFYGNGVFGTYLIENILRETYLPLYNKLCGDTYSPAVLFVWIMLVVLSGICITNLVKLIPGLRKLL